MRLEILVGGIILGIIIFAIFHNNDDDGGSFAV